MMKHNTKGQSHSVTKKSNNMKHSITLTLTAALLLSPLAALHAAEAGNSAAATPQKPNVVILFLDDVSAQDFGCYGVRDPKIANTPTIDRLANEGGMFTQCWATPLCSPSRAMMMTGRLAPKNLWWENGIKPKGNEEGACFAIKNLVANKIFHDNGYASAFLGKWQLGGVLSDPAYGIDYGLTSGWGEGKDPYPHNVWPEISPMPNQKSWEFYPAMFEWNSETGKKGYLPTKETDYAADIEMESIKRFIKKQVQSNRPFFVYWATHVGHEAWDFNRKETGGWTHTSLPLKDQDGKQLYNEDGSPKLSSPTYKAHVEYSDYMMREIRKFLDQEKLADNTIVVFAADNGAKYFGKGSVIQQRGTHVPLIIRAPGIKPLNKPAKALVSLADVTPTLVDLAGLKLPEGYTFDGTSLKPILTGVKESVRDIAISYLNFFNMARDDRYILDGWGTLWDTHYSLVSDNFTDVSNNPELNPVKEKLKAYADKCLPRPSDSEPFWKRALEKKEMIFKRMKKHDQDLLQGKFLKNYDNPDQGNSEE